MYKNNLIFDHQQIEIFRKRAIKTGKEQSDFLLCYAVKDLQYRLKDVNRRFVYALDLHSYNNLLANSLIKNNIEKVLRVETSHLFLRDYENVIVSPREDLTIIPDGFDLVTSLLSMQFINNLPLYLQQVKSKLKDDGLFIGALLGDGSLNELRQSFIEAEIIENGGASPRISPLIELKTLGDLLSQAGFSFPVVDSEEILVEYSSFAMLLKDLKSWGGQNALFSRSKKPILRKTLQLAEKIYCDKYALNKDNTIKVTFRILWFSAWQNCKSHQKPAIPGSANISLKDVL